MLTSFSREPITRLRAPLIVDHGSYVRDWSDAVEAVIAGWSIQPGASAEDLLHRDAVRADWTLYGPYAADLLTTDRVRMADGDYSVIGSPERWKSPTGSVSHTKVLLQRWADHG